MSSNIFSRVLPVAGTQSVYEAIQQDEQAIEARVPISHADTAIDDQNLGERFTDEDIDHLLAEATESRISTESPESHLHEANTQPKSDRYDAYGGGRQPKWMQDGIDLYPRTNHGLVPDSLLLEQAPVESSTRSRKTPLPARPSELPSPVPGPSSGRTRVRWNTASPQKPSRGAGVRNMQARVPAAGNNVLGAADPAEKAMYRWTNVENLDNFLNDVYEYYLEKGIWSMMLARFLGHLTQAFVVCAATFLLECVDYSALPTAKSPLDSVISGCTKNMPAYLNLLIWLFSFYWIIRLFQHVIDIPRLWQLHSFYTHLLHIPDEEIQTISWQEVVGRLMNLREANPRTAINMAPQSRKYIDNDHQSKQRMDAHDIANRLMRKENYLIALFNKDVLNLTPPIPFLRNRQLFSKSLEWNINLCVFAFVFNDEGQVKQAFLKDTRRRELIEGLQRRFRFFAIVNVLVAPFVVCFLILLYFLKYFTEFQKNPSQIGARSYTPLAEWKFREFNELWHLFERRANISYPFASRYIDQFPKDKTVQIARFVAFITGAIAALLGIASFLDFQAFVFYLGIFGSIWVVSRGMIPEDNLVFDPEYAIQNVIEFTHYNPAHWKGRLHSEEVRNDFSRLYQMKIVIFLEEILSIIITPFVLWFSLPLCSDRIVDFFREFTIHVDGLGYVCSFALFDFQRGDKQSSANMPNTPAAAKDLREDYYSTKDGKMLSSYYSFIDSYTHNPRRGTNKQYGKRNFFPPPSFPGLAASAGLGIPVGSTAAAPGIRDVSHPLNRIRNDVRLSSPSPSLLLDPSHQPAAPMDVTRHRSSHRHQQMRSLQIPENVRELPPAMTTSDAVEEDIHLGGSWRTTQAAMRSGDADRSDDDDTAVEGEGGVLNLLYQFQKAQTEGRGAGVNI